MTLFVVRCSLTGVCYELFDVFFRFWCFVCLFLVCFWFVVGSVLALVCCSLMCFLVCLFDEWCSLRFVWCLFVVFDVVCCLVLLVAWCLLIIVCCVVLLVGVSCLLFVVCCFLFDVCCLLVLCV